MLVGEFDHSPGDDYFFGRQIRGSGGLGRLFAVKICKRCGKIGSVIVRLVARGSFIMGSGCNTALAVAIGGVAALRLIARRRGCGWE